MIVPRIASHMLCTVHMSIVSWPVLVLALLHYTVRGYCRVFDLFLFSFTGGTEAKPLLLLMETRRSSDYGSPRVCEFVEE